MGCQRHPPNWLIDRVTRRQKNLPLQLVQSPVPGWVGEVTRFRDYLLLTIKSYSTQKEKVPHLAHLGHLGHRYSALVLTPLSAPGA